MGVIHPQSRKLNWECFRSRVSLGSRYFPKDGQTGGWVKVDIGNPGNGKTVLTASTIDGFKTSKEFEPESNAKICYFFFNYSEKSLNHSAAAYRAILAQILQSRRHEPEVLDRYSFAMNEISSGQASATREELLELLRILLVGPQDYYLFLDGVDECNDSDELVRDLIQIKETSKVRLLISSRPNVEILLREAASTSIVTMSGKTSNDISCYISRNVLSLQARELLSFEADGNTLTRHLVTGADGMFLWAKLMVVYLSSPFMTSEERFEAIQNVVVPEGIETMYERILAHIDRGYKIQKGFADRIFAWLLYAKEPLTALRFMEATGSSPRSAAARNIDDLEEFSRAVVIGCCGLVEGVYEGSGSVEVWQLTHFRFIHLSAKEFFQRASSSRTSGVVTRLESHILIAQKCLQYLTYSAPAGPLSGNTGQDVSQADLDKGFPLCSYAAKYWIDHICRTQGDVDEGFPKEPYSHLLSSLEQFLSQKLVLMAWIEACYVIVHPPTRGKLEDWCVWAAQLQYAGFSEEVDIGVLCQDIQDLMVYLEKLSRDWGKTLSSTQACLWEEVIAFSPCRLLVHTNAIHVHYFESYGPTKRSSSKCLCKISQTTPLGHLMAVLSIWPSK